ncbi:hypothetical protein Gotur_028168, partial [Gossypium turneri]
INLPPSPPTLPILGHLHLLKEPFNQSLFVLSQKHGPIFSLRLGSRLAIVLSSPSIVEECLTKNDVIFANRPYFWVGKYISYDYTTIISSPYGDHWRNLRRICKLEIFSANRLNSSSSIRQDEIKNLLWKLYYSSSDDNFVKVELKPLLSKLTFNITLRMIAGKKHKPEAVKLHGLQQELLKLGISPIVGDFFPLLRNKYGFEKEDTVISHLLRLQESKAQYYTDEIIKGIVQDMLLGGTNTVVIALEWSMSHLLNNLNIMQKSKSELDFHIGHGRLLDETDLPRLSYLQNIISETLRLNPAVPLLVPHVSSDRCNLLGYNIPKGTMLLVNAWAIHRDPKLWDEATCFKPERFENGRAEGYKMMPFGLGRRACPGIDLGQRVVGLVLGSLIQCFEWKRVSSKKIDMAEGKGLNSPKAKPIEAFCKVRNTAKELLS